MQASNAVHAFGRPAFTNLLRTSVVKVTRVASYWLCPRGTEGDPFPPDWFHQDTWRQENTRGYGTGIRGTPRIKPGDQIVWYATTWGVLYGLAEVTGRPEQRQVRGWQGDRWPWYIPARTQFVVADLSIAPTLEEAGLPWTGAVRSYRALSREQFTECSRQIKRRGKPYDESSL